MSQRSAAETRVLLVYPSFDREEQYGDFADLVWKEIPLSLGFLAGYLRERGVAIRIVDEQWGSLDEARIGELVAEFQPDLVGFSTLTPVFYRALELARLFKRASQELTVVLGNVHPTVFPEESLAEEAVDLVVRGEGEVTLWEILKSLTGEMALADVLGVSYRENGHCVHNEERPFQKDLDLFPGCAYDLIQEGLPGRPAPSVILTSRGCPYRCIFCSSRAVSGYTYRANSAERVLSDVQALVDAYGIPHLLFADDNFVVSRSRAVEICRLFIEHGLHRHLQWACQARGDAIDEELAPLLREAGCVQMSFGIETGSQRLLDLIDKKEQVEDNARAVELVHRAGIRTRGAFILGLPTETREESLGTIRFAKSLPLDIAKFALATPYPGTVLLDIARAEGAEIERDWSRLSTMAGLGHVEPCYVPQGRTASELERLQRRAHLAFYLRPAQIWAILRGRNPEIRIGSWREFARYGLVATRMAWKVVSGGLRERLRRRRTVKSAPGD